LVADILAIPVKEEEREQRWSRYLRHGYKWISARAIT
jgi:hypothetical protein